MSYLISTRSFESAVHQTADAMEIDAKMEQQSGYNGGYTSLDAMSDRLYNERHVPVYYTDGSAWSVGWTVGSKRQYTKAEDEIRLGCGIFGGPEISLSMRVPFDDLSLTGKNSGHAEVFAILYVLAIAKMRDENEVEIRTDYEPEVHVIRRLRRTYGGRKLPADFATKRLTKTNGLLLAYHETYKQIVYFMQEIILEIKYVPGHDGRGNNRADYLARRATNFFNDANSINKDNFVQLIRSRVWIFGPKPAEVQETLPSPDNQDEEHAPKRQKLSLPNDSNNNFYPSIKHF